MFTQWKNRWHHKNISASKLLIIRASYFSEEILLGNWDLFANTNKHCVDNLNTKKLSLILAVVVVQGSKQKSQHYHICIKYFTKEDLALKNEIRCKSHNIISFKFHAT